MDDLYVKTTSRTDDAADDSFSEGPSKRHRSQVQRLKSHELGASPRSPASVSSPRTESADAESPVRWEQSQNKVVNASKTGPVHRGRGRPPKNPRPEGSPTVVNLRLVRRDLQWSITC
jgi:hypothetical protein